MNEPLYQVFVELPCGERIAASPKMGKKACAMLRGELDKAIIDGKRPGWGNPHVERAMTTH